MPENEKIRVLFLCTANAARSQMAAGIVQHDFGDRIETYSAGTNPKGVSRLAVMVLDELGIDISGETSDPLDKYKDMHFDYVITLCDDANEKCPLWLGQGNRVHIGFDDPASAIGSEAEQMIVFRRVRDEIRERLLGYLNEQVSV